MTSPRAQTLLLGSTLCLALLIAGLGSWRLWATADPGPGPMNPHLPAKEYTSTGIPVFPGGVSTWSTIMLDNPGAEPAIVERVALVPPPSGQQVRASRIWIARVPGHPRWAAKPGWPPKGMYRDSHQPAGAVIPAHSQQRYAVEMTVQPLPRYAGQLARADGVDIWYHVNGHHYRDRWPYQVVLCPRSCRPWSADSAHHITRTMPPKPAYLPK